MVENKRLDNFKFELPMDFKWIVKSIWDDGTVSYDFRIYVNNVYVRDVDELEFENINEAKSEILRNGIAGLNYDFMKALKKM